jgi:hypothetical protein
MHFFIKKKLGKKYTHPLQTITQLSMSITRNAKKLPFIPLFIKQIDFNEKVVSDVTSETIFSLKSIYLMKREDERGMRGACVAPLVYHKLLILLMSPFKLPKHINVSPKTNKKIKMIIIFFSIRQKCHYKFEKKN